MLRGGGNHVVHRVLSAALALMIALCTCNVTAFADPTWTQTPPLSIVDADIWKDPGYEGFPTRTKEVNSMGNKSYQGIAFFANPNDIELVGIHGWQANSVTYNGYMFMFKGVKATDVSVGSGSGRYAGIVVKMKDGRYFQYAANNWVYTLGSSYPDYGDIGVDITVDARNTSPVIMSINNAGNSYDGNMSTLIGISYGLQDIYVDGKKLDSSQYTVTDRLQTSPRTWYKEIKLQPALLQTLVNGNHTVILTTQDGGGYSRKFTVTNSPAVESVEPSLTSTEYTYDGTNPTDPFYGAELGEGDAKATDIEGVTVDGKDVTASLVGGNVVIDKDSIASLENGEYDVVVTFNNTGKTECTAKLTVENVTHTPSMEPGTINYDKNVKSNDDSFTLTLWKNTITSVKVGNDAVPNTGYTFDADTGEFKFTGDFLNSLDEGNYDVTISVSDGTDLTDGKVSISDTTPPSMVPDAITFDKGKGDGDKEISVDDRGKGIDSVELGDETVPSDKWSFVDGTLTISGDYLKDKDNDTYDVTVTVGGTGLTGVTIEVVGKIPPSMESQKVTYNKSGDTDKTFNINDSGETVTSVKIGDNELAPGDYDYADGVLTIKGDFLLTLDVDNYTLTVIMSDGTELDNSKVVVIDSTEPSMDGGNKDYTRGSSTDIPFGLDDRGLGISEVKVGDKTLGSGEYEFSGGVLTIKGDGLDELPDGKQDITVSLNGGKELTGASITVITAKVPSMPAQNKEFDKNGGYDVEISLDDADKGIGKVIVGGTEIPSTGYDYDNGKLTISAEELKGLPEGSKDVEVTLGDGTKLTGVVIVIVDTTTPPSGEVDSNKFIYDAENPGEITITPVVGGIEDVGVPHDVNDDGSVTIKPEYLESLPNGEYTVNITMDDGTKIGVIILVINAGGGEENPTPGEDEEYVPPHALTIITYEYYKDSPEDVIIPINMGSAKKISKVIIDDEEVSEVNWKFKYNALVISPDYCDTLDEGKHWVVIEFDNKPTVLISNIRLKVYDAIADLEEPALFQRRIVFEGQDLSLRYHEGKGELIANDIVALIIEGNLYLPDGTCYEYSDEIVDEIIRNNSLQADDEDSLATKSNATKSRAARTAKAARANDVKFHVEGKNIMVDGSWVESLGLVEGRDYICGAIFDNTVNTEDPEKVILTLFRPDGSYAPVEGPGTGDETEKPGTGEGTEKPGTGEGTEKPGTGEGTEKPGTGEGTEKPGTGEDTEKPGAGEGTGGTEKPGTGTGEGTEKPGAGEGTDKPGTGTGGSSGSGGSGGSSSSGGSGRRDNTTQSNLVKHKDGSINTGYKPYIPNTGGTISRKNVGIDGEVSVYTLPNGEVPIGTWLGDGINWYYQGTDGYLLTDWFLDFDGSWYHLNKESAAMDRGWYFEQADGKWYYLNPVDGRMLWGWQFIDSNWYYFNPPALQTYFGDNSQGWSYDYNTGARPYGSMYCNEVTPDNYTVNADGAWVK